MTIYIQNKNLLLIIVDSGCLRNKVPPLGLQKQSNAKDLGIVLFGLAAQEGKGNAK